MHNFSQNPFLFNDKGLEISNANEISSGNVKFGVTVGVEAKDRVDYGDRLEDLGVLDSQKNLQLKKMKSL